MHASLTTRVRSASTLPLAWTGERSKCREDESAETEGMWAGRVLVIGADLDKSPTSLSMLYQVSSTKLRVWQLLESTRWDRIALERQEVAGAV